MKLNWEKAAEIRIVYAAGGISQRELGRQYGVSQRQILSVLKNRSWPREAAP
jgi:lambda repressor-like predicted transcriptional regulator